MKLMILIQKSETSSSVQHDRRDNSVAQSCLPCQLFSLYTNSWGVAKLLNTCER